MRRPPLSPTTNVTCAPMIWHQAPHRGISALLVRNLDRLKRYSLKTLEDIRLKPRDRDAIMAACSLLRARFPVSSITLFGSKARGDDDEESDIDLLILTSIKLTWSERWAITEALYPIQLAHDVVISTLVITEDEWDNGVHQVLPIRAEIQEQGVAA